MVSESTLANRSIRYLPHMFVVQVSAFPEPRPIPGQRDLKQIGLAVCASDGRQIVCGVDENGDLFDLRAQ